MKNQTCLLTFYNHRVAFCHIIIAENAHFHFELLSFPVYITTSIIYQKNFVYSLNTLHLELDICTNRSKTNENTGAGFYVNGYDYSYQVEKDSSIFSLKLFAILKALECSISTQFLKF